MKLKIKTYEKIKGEVVLSRETNYDHGGGYKTLEEMRAELRRRNTNRLVEDIPNGVRILFNGEPSQPHSQEIVLN